MKKSVQLHVWPDCSSDLLLYDSSGEGLPEPYDPDEVASALDLIETVVARYREARGR